MNICARLPGMGWNIAVQRDLDRLVEMWRTPLALHGGPFLFGAFGAVDAYFAPVLSRFATYAAVLPEDITCYRDAVLECDGMRAWCDAARLETEFVVEDEPYRLPPPR
jgi:glutathione S-transferase